MMRNKIYLFFLFILLGTTFLSFPCFCHEIKPLPGFTNKDRVLILVPHPDDEAIGTAGVIQRAKKAGAEVKVVCSTNGEHNELAFIVYEKRLVFRKGGFIYMGQVRRKETIAAMKSLNLTDKDIIFLGYPDFGTMEIFNKYWQDTKPFKDLLTRISMVPYPDALSPNALYVGESILKDLKTILLDFQPTKIFVSHPVDTNRDHRALYLFLQVALWDIEGQFKRPEIFPYLIHVVGWPKPRGAHPELGLMPPPKLEKSGISWQTLELADEEIKAKKQAISFYKSQIVSNPPYLFSFVRKNELFGDYPVIKLKKQNTSQIQWNSLEIYQQSEEEEEDEQETYISNLAFALKDKDLFIKLTPKKRKHFKGSIFLIGYSKSRDFSQMPKIHLNINGRMVQIKDKKQAIFVKDVQLSYDGKSSVVQIPLSLLGNPDYLLSCIRTNAKDLKLDDTAWLIVKLK